MRILFLNWRDLANPLAGGAETFTEEIGKRLVASGNEVTIFTSSFDGCKPETCRFGMRIIRDGGKYGVYMKARGYVKQHSAEFDIIVDEINTVPFRIHRLAKDASVVAVIHQLAREVWFYETKFPINVIGYFALERLWLRGYKNIPTVTVSNSTKNSLVDLGFKRVHVVSNGIGAPPLGSLPLKDPSPALIFVGRLVRSKLPEHALLVFKHVKISFPHAELWVLGDGYLRAKLEKLAPDGVKFFGRVGDQEKFELLKRARLLVAPSVREGWGISVIEANAMGTPAVGYDVPGLRDSIVDGVTGSLVRPMCIRDLAEAAIRILRSSFIAEKLAKNALSWSRRFSWDTAARDFEAVLQSVVN